jgi:hypothetical protein
VALFIAALSSRGAFASLVDPFSLCVWRGLGFTRLVPCSEVVDLTAANIAADTLALAKMGDIGLMAAAAVRVVAPGSPEILICVLRALRRRCSHALFAHWLMVWGPLTLLQAVKSGNYRVAKPVKLVAPITGVGKIVCVGMNYVEHCTEQGMPVPTEPVIFNKFPNTICGTGVPIDACAVETQEMDFEVELAGAYRTVQ